MVSAPIPPGLHPDEFFEVTWPVAPPALRMPMDARRWTNHHGILCPCVWKLGGYPLNDLNAQMCFVNIVFWEGDDSLLGKLGRSIFRSTLKFPGLGARGQFQSSASLLRFFEHLFNGSKFDPCLCVFSFHLLLGWPIGNDGSPNLPTSLQNLHVGDTSTSSSTKYCFSVFSPIQRSVTGMIPHGPVSILSLQEMRLPAVPALTLHARNLSCGQRPTSNCGCCAFSQLCFSMFQKPVTTMLIMLSWIRAILKKFDPMPTLTIRQPCNHGTGPKPQMPSQCY